MDALLLVEMFLIMVELVVPAYVYKHVRKMDGHPKKLDEHVRALDEHEKTLSKKIGQGEIKK
jgi:hypothetical protein